MKAENEIINEVLELYEFHKSESDKFCKILGILRGTPDDNKIKPPVPLPAEKQTLPPPTGLKVSEPKPKKIDAKIEYSECKDPRCKKKFKPVRKGQVYCSKECANRGSVYLNYLSKKKDKQHMNGKNIKKQKEELIQKKEDKSEKKDHRGKYQKHLKSESFYNGASAMP